jgi:nicotinamide/nicotinate riboside kinase
VGKCPIADEEIAAEKAKVQKWLKEGSSGFRILEETGRKLCFVDGFLLYGSVLGTVMKLLDLKLFLLASRTKLIERREARDGYVTLEGFWKDPPGYIEKVVWPNYAEAHSWLFRNGEVEGELDLHVLDKANIQAQTGHGLDSPLNVSLSWAVDQVIAALEAAYPVSKLEETS